jgi:hypothetical protein
LFDSIQIEPIFPVDQVDSKTKMTKATRATNAMQVSFGVLGKVEIDDNIDSLNIYSAGQEIRAHEVSANTVAEVMEYAVAVVLQHARVRIEARVSKLSNLLGKKLNAIGRVTEDDGLVNLQLVEQSVQAVNFLFLLNKGIVLRDTAKSQFVHQVDLVRRVHVLVLYVKN